MTTFVEQLEIGARVRYPAPPSTVAPAAYGGVGTFAAPGVDGVVTDWCAGPSTAALARVRFEYRDVGGKTLLSPPLGVLPGQPCEVVV